jgi:hypothetical protein
MHTDECAPAGLELFVWMGVFVVLASLGIVLVPLAYGAQQDFPQADAARAQVLMTRVGPPSDLALDEFKKAGMRDIRPHALTAPERAKIGVVLASLPLLNTRVLEKKLHHLAFVDGVPGEGTGLTSPDAKTGLYDITLRASLLNESLSTFLTTKERRVFSADGSGLSIAVTGTGTDALTYVLLHESTHVVDQSCKITSAPESHISRVFWIDLLTMKPEWASSAASNTYFRRGPRLGIAQAAKVYDALAQTPFVSLYATASEQEDFAELVAWREVMEQHGGSLSIELKNAGGETIRRWEPLKFSDVQKRFADVDDLLTSQGSCSALS